MNRDSIVVEMAEPGAAMLLFEVRNYKSNDSNLTFKLLKRFDFVDDFQKYEIKRSDFVCINVLQIYSKTYRI